MDTCCYNRPFDNQEQARIYIESEIILAILAKCDKGEWSLLYSEALEFELSNDPDEERRKYLLTLYGGNESTYPLTEDIRLRARDFQKLGVKPFDSLHLATAEVADADLLLTVDDQFVASSKRTNARVRVTSPINLLEVLKNEYGREL